MDLQIISELSKILLKTTLVVTAMQGQIVPITQNSVFIAPENPQVVLSIESPTSTLINAFNAKETDFNSEIEEILYQFSIAYKVDYDLAKAIIECESNFNPLAKNKNSSARGLFQIIKGTFEQTMKKMGISKADPLDAEDNINIGMWLLAREGSGHWRASRACWSKKLLAYK